MELWVQILGLALPICGGFWALTKVGIQAISIIQASKKGLDERLTGIEARQREMGQRIGGLSATYHKLEKRVDKHEEAIPLTLNELEEKLDNFRTDYDENKNSQDSLNQSAKYKFRSLSNRVSIIEKHLEGNGVRIIPGKVESDSSVSSKDTYS